MSSPSPSPQAGIDHTYQSGDTGDHPCQCNEKTNRESSKCDANLPHSHITNKSGHHHNLLNVTSHGNPSTHTHTTNQAVHVHVHSPPGSTHGQKIQSISCNCHLQTEVENNADIHQCTVPNRKNEADDRIEVSPLPPALPPRPPPRPRTDGSNTLSSRSRLQEGKSN